MDMEYSDVRKMMEERGFALDDGEYQEVLAYARRKAECAGKGEPYLPLLLPDVIRERAFRSWINAQAAVRMGAGI